MYIALGWKQNHDTMGAGRKIIINIFYYYLLFLLYYSCLTVIKMFYLWKKDTIFLSFMPATQLNSVITCVCVQAADKELFL